jgi:hypothetical protein
MSTVVDVHVKSIRPKYNNLEEWMNDPVNVYIGRRGVLILNSKRFPPKDSIWANPYKIKGDETREVVLEKYETYIRDRLENDPSLVEQLLMLEGKRLGCWCSGLSCHGNILVRLIDEYK